METANNLIWKPEYNKYLQLQRNHKNFNSDMLDSLIQRQKCEIAEISKYLIRTPRTVLDIGCGLGIYDLAIDKFYSEPINYYLLDKTTDASEESNVFYGYQQVGAFYNNLDTTTDFLTSNGIEKDRLHMLSVASSNETTNIMLQNTLQNVDLIISIISWGFHYPVSTYLDTVDKILAPDGIVCFHCRSLVENIPLIQTKFQILYPSKLTEGCLIICQKKMI
jgi:SAM-dependent methyltransferase